MLLCLSQTKPTKMNAEKFSCIRQVVKTVKIPLWDMYTTTEYKGIEAALDKWKWQYEKQVGGIVVNYKDVSIPSRLGFHSDRASYAIYNVQATFDIFCPKVDEIVKGKINRVSSEHIGCLIAETINVSIRLPRDSPCGLSKYIYINREILFMIRSFSSKPRALCVEGDITDKCIELMDAYYPVIEECFGDVPSDGYQPKVFDGNATDSPKIKKIKKEQFSQERKKRKVKKIKKDKKKDSSKEKKNSSKKGKITASGDILKKTKKKSKKSLKKDDKSKSSKKNKKNKRKKIKLTNDSDVDVHLKEIKSEGI